MSTFTGKQGKGAMRRHREAKRVEAELRNATADPHFYTCGHVHGATGQRCDSGGRVA